jgi:hypothetical protein
MPLFSVLTVAAEWGTRFRRGKLSAVGTCGDFQEWEGFPHKALGIIDSQQVLNSTEALVRFQLQQKQPWVLLWLERQAFLVALFKLTFRPASQDACCAKARPVAEVTVSALTDRTTYRSESKRIAVF